MRLTAVGYDYLQSEIIKKLTLELEIRGHTVAVFVGNGKLFPAQAGEVEYAVAGSDVVLITISNRTEEEVAAGEAAAKHGKPLCLFAAAFKGYQMPAFTGLRPDIRMLFRTTGDRMEDAHKLFPNAEILTVGDPFWEAWASPRFSRDEVRKQFSMREGEILLACAGDKYPGDNLLMIGCLLEAAEKLSGQGLKLKVVVGFHPGDPLDRRFYESLFARTDIPVAMTGSETMPLGDAVVGADVLVNTVSTIGIQAAYQSVPSINFMSIFTRPMLKRNQGGDDTWDPCDNLGIAKAIRGSPVEELAAVISEYARTGFSSFLAKRNEVFPEPFEQGKCIRLMADALEKLI